MTLLITGVAGFIGSKIAKQAIKKGYKVYGVDDLSQGTKENIPEGIEFLNLDLSRQENIPLLPEVETILHLAGQSSGEISFDNPVTDLEKNVCSTLNLIEYGIKKKSKKIIYASSMSVYGSTEDRPISENETCSPLSCYGVGKLAAENYLRIYKDEIPYTSFRMFNVYGPGQDMKNLRQGMVSIYLAYALTNSHIPIKGAINRFRDFIYIDDVVSVWMEAITNLKSNNETYNLATGIRTSVEELLKMIQVKCPNVTFTEILSTKGDQFGIYADISKLVRDFNFEKPITLNDGVEKFISWITR